MSSAVNVRDAREHPFFIVDNAIIARHGRAIGPYGIAVYTALAMHAGKGRRCNPSLATIAGEIGASQRRVRQALRDLEAAGILETVAPPSGVKTSNVYTLTTVNADTPAPGAAPACGAGMTPALSAAPAPGAAKQDIKQSSPIGEDVRSQVASLPSSGPAARRRAAPVRKGPPRTKAEAAGPPTPHQALFGAVCDACGLDPAFLDGHTTANVGKAAAFFAAQGVDPATIVAAWAAEHDRLAAAFPERTISPPTVARLKVIVGSYRKATAPPRPAAPADSRPPIGAVLSRLGLSESQPERWPPDVLARYRDIAEMWGYAPAGGAS